MNASRLPSRLSLKSFLIATFCVAVFAGAIGRQWFEVLRRDSSIDSLASESDGNVWMFSVEGRQVVNPKDGTPNSVYLMDLDSDRLAKNIQHVAKIEIVAELNLAGSVLDAKSLAFVPSNPRIKDLTLDYCEGLDAETCSIIARKFPGVRKISLANSDIQKEGLESLRHLESLRTADLSRLSIDVNELVSSCESFPTLKEIVLHDAVLKGELQSFCRLENLALLDVSFCSFAAVDLANLMSCTSCAEVIVIGVDVNPFEVELLLRGPSDKIVWE